MLLGSFSERLKGVRVRDIDGLAGARPGFCFRTEVYRCSEVSGTHNSGQNLGGRSCSPWDFKPLWGACSLKLLAWQLHAMPTEVETRGFVATMFPGEIALFKT